MKIPIENIYYLLSYSWNQLEQKDKVKVDLDGKTELVDLFASIMIGCCKHLLKRGISQNYTEYSNELNGIKGKLLTAETIKRNSLFRQRAFCEFDELSPDILINRIIFTTLGNLIKTDNLDYTLRLDLFKIRRRLINVAPIKLNNAVFRNLHLNKHNSFYSFILNVCELIYENSLPSEQEGQFNFFDFTRDEKKMNRLFESFLRNFFKKEQSKYPIVKKEIIKWKLKSENLEALKYLPQMETDITLENDTDKIIIDAKYYRETMSARYGNEKIKSQNLYQLFSYLINQNDNPGILTRGILLYPTVKSVFNLKYSFDQYTIEIKTINLMQKWEHIKLELLNIL